MHRAGLNENLGVSPHLIFHGSPALVDARPASDIDHNPGALWCHVDRGIKRDSTESDRGCSPCLAVPSPSRRPVRPSVRQRPAAASPALHACLHGYHPGPVTCFRVVAEKYKCHTLEMNWKLFLRANFMKPQTKYLYIMYDNDGSGGGGGGHRDALNRPPTKSTSPRRPARLSI